LVAVVPASASAITVRSTGEADVVTQGPSNSSWYYDAVPGGGWTATEIAGPGTTFSALSIYVRSTDPKGEADIAVQGATNSLQYYDAVPGATWANTQIAGNGTTFD
jgi:hypothetical protein